MGLTIGYSPDGQPDRGADAGARDGLHAAARPQWKKRIRWFDAVVRGYEKLLRFSLAHRAPVLLAAVALLGLACSGRPPWAPPLSPAMDSPQMSATLELPKGTDTRTLYETTDEVVARMLAVDGVETVGAMEGGGMMGGSSSGGMSFYILLGDDVKATNAEVARQLRDAVADLDCTLEVSASTMDMSALGGSGIEIELKGRDLDQLQAAADEVAALVESTEGTLEVSTGSGEADPEMRVTVDRDKAMRKGLTTAQVYAELAAALKAETTATTLTQGQNDYPVIVVGGADAAHPRQPGRLPVHRHQRRGRGGELPAVRHRRASASGPASPPSGATRAPATGRSAPASTPTTTWAWSAASWKRSWRPTSRPRASP